MAPPRASFMGLPVELRLQIYALLPEPIDLTLQKHNLLKSGQSSIISRMIGRPLRLFERQIHYDSSSMTILRVNKQVFAEAMPVIYQNIELGPMFKYEPPNIRDNVRSIMLLCGLPNSRAVEPYTPGLMYSLGRVYAGLALKYRYVQNVRVCIDTGSQLVWHGMQGFDSGSLSLLSFPNLRSVVVELYDEEGPSGQVYRLPGTIRDRMVNDLVAEFKAAKRDIAVSTRSFRVNEGGITEYERR